MQDDNRLVFFPTECHSRPRRLSLIAFLITEIIHQSSQFIICQIHRNRLDSFYQFFNLSHLCNLFSFSCNYFSVARLLYLKTSEKSRDFFDFFKKNKTPPRSCNGNRRRRRAGWTNCGKRSANGTDSLINRLSCVPPFPPNRLHDIFSGLYRYFVSLRRYFKINPVHKIPALCFLTRFLHENVFFVVHILQRIAPSHHKSYRRKPSEECVKRE